MFKYNIEGSSSTVFTRYHENKIYIKQSKDKLYESIVGYGVNLLHLYCLSQKMPIGCLIIRSCENNLIQSGCHHSTEATEWLDRT